MKFSQVVKGNRALKTIDLPLVGPPTNGKKPSMPVTLRVLSGEESAEILESARDYAVKCGSKEPKAGDPLYELGLRVHTLLMGCVDSEHPNPESPDARFFASEEEILGSYMLGRDGIWFLFEAHEAWQDHCAPQVDAPEGAEFWAAVMEVAKSSDPLALEAYRPATRWSLARSMALLLLNSPALKLLSGGPSESSSKTEESAAPKPKKQSRRQTSKAS